MPRPLALAEGWQAIESELRAEFTGKITERMMRALLGTAERVYYSGAHETLDICKAYMSYSACGKEPPMDLMTRVIALMREAEEFWEAKAKEDAARRKRQHKGAVNIQ